MKKNRMIFPLLSTTIVSVPLLTALSCGNPVQEALWKPGATSTQVWGVACTGTLDQTQPAQAREVLSQFASSEHYVETSPNMSDAEVASTYINAINRGAKVIVSASGSHRNVIENVLASNQEVSLFRLARFITLDEPISNSQVFNLSFNVSEGAFLAGVAAADFAASANAEKPEVLVASTKDATEAALAQSFTAGVKFYNASASANVKVSLVEISAASTSAFAQIRQSASAAIFATNNAFAAELSDEITSDLTLSGRKIITTNPLLANQSDVLTVINRNIATVLTATLNEIYSSYVQVPRPYAAPNDLLKSELKKLSDQNIANYNSLWGQSLSGGLESGFVSLSNQDRLFARSSLAPLYQNALQAAKELKR